MRRFRIPLIFLGILAVIAALFYTAQSLDLGGMIAQAHVPPQH